MIAPPQKKEAIMNEIKKFFYVSKPGWYSNKIDFTIIWASVGKKELRVKERKCIIGNNYDVRINSDNKNIFDNLSDAVKRYTEMNINMQNMLKAEVTSLAEEFAKLQTAWRELDKQE